MTTRQLLLRFMACFALALAACDDGGSDPAPTPGDAAPGDAAPGDAAVADAGPVIGACGDTPATMADCADLTRYSASLELVARPRLPGSAHWQAVQDECAAVFEAAGFAVERQDHGGGISVIGVKPGVDQPNEHVMISAHYDHIGECAGADDNATGVAAVLEAARVLGEGTFARTIVLACWDAEEFGKGGSRSYAARVTAAADVDLRAHFVLEMLGYRDPTPNSQFLPPGFDALFADAAAQLDARMGAGDFIAMITHASHAGNAPLIEAAEVVGLPVIPIEVPDALLNDPSLGDLRRSDHEPFWAAGLPAMMLGDTGDFRNPNYHCSRGEDDIAALDLEFALGSVKAVVHATADLAGIVTRAGATAEPLAPLPAAPIMPVCDPFAQDCPDGQRCHMVFDNGWGERCIPMPAEPTGLDEVCAQAIGGVRGNDSCAPRTLCAFWGLPRSTPQERRCRALCQRNDECGPDEACLLLGGDTRTGGCVPKCDPVANDCQEGTRCIVLRATAEGESATLCALPGDGAIGDACRVDGDCAEGTCQAGSAVGESRCRAFCRGDGDCGDGMSCFPIIPQAGLPADTGLCLPSR